MALFVRQNEQRSELQSKVAADLAERLKNKQIDQKETPSTFMENQHTTRAVSVLWIILLMVVVAAIIYIIVARR